MTTDSELVETIRNIIDGHDGCDVDYCGAREEIADLLDRNPRPPKHIPGNPVHRDCPACKQDIANGVPFTLTPASETYWQS